VEPPTSPRPGDLRATARVSTPGFSGVNERVWISADDFRRFVEALRVLERERRGEAELRGMSPDTLALSFRVRDGLGHVSASGWVGRTSHDRAHGRVAARVGFGFDIDPTELPRIVAELARFVSP